MTTPTPERHELFCGHRTRYTQAGTQFATDGRMQSWHDACRARRTFDSANPYVPGERTDASSAYTRAIRRLVEESGEDPNDTMAVRIAMGVIDRVAETR